MDGFSVLPDNSARRGATSSRAAVQEYSRFCSTRVSLGLSSSHDSRDSPRFPSRAFSVAPVLIRLQGHRTFSLSTESCDLNRDPNRACSSTALISFVLMFLAQESLISSVPCKHARPRARSQTNNNPARKMRGGPKRRQDK